MTRLIRRASAGCLRLLPWVAAGFAASVLLGVLYVLIAWFPDAMASFADNPQFVDPRNVLMGWSGTFGTVSGLVGALIGLGLGAVSSGRESLRGRGSRGPDVQCRLAQSTRCSRSETIVSGGH